MKRGFTLIEILVAVTVVAILAAIGVTSYTSITARSRDAKRKGDLEQIRSSLEMYRADLGYYPSTGAGSYTDASGLATPLTGYATSIPRDPKAVQYRYRALNLSGGQYYGYCLSTTVEKPETGYVAPCTVDTGRNYSLANP